MKKIKAFFTSIIEDEKLTLPLGLTMNAWLILSLVVFYSDVAEWIENATVIIFAVIALIAFLNMSHRYARMQ